MNATGYAFNSAAGLERAPEGRTNPMVNAGAIATTSLARGKTAEERWRFLHERLSRFAGRGLAVNEEVYASATETDFRNRSLVWMLESRGRIYCDPLEALDLYARQCALNVTARDLAVTGATLADGGFNPITREQGVSQEVRHYVLAVMITAGLLPGKSGISGGIVTVSPGKGSLGVFAPPLDEAGASVRGQLSTQYLSRRLGLDMLVSSLLKQDQRKWHRRPCQGGADGWRD